ncbi:DUF485 domain-containing protein [Rhodococcus fascians]|nr:DUF485 domain-containing protein [Rhodococcus fascians]
MSSSTDDPEQIANTRLDDMWASSGMKSLLAQRRRFFIRAFSIFAIAWTLFLVWPVFLPDSYSHVLTPGLSVGMLVCAMYVITCFALTVWYSRSAGRWDNISRSMIDNGASIASSTPRSGQHG